MTGPTPKELMLAGDLYLADDPELAADQRRAIELTAAYNAALDPAEHARILGKLLGHVGEGVTIRPPLYVDYGEHFSVGARTFANFGLVVLDTAAVTVGEDCQIGSNVQLLAALHPLEPVPRRDKWEYSRPVVIGDNVWLGAGVIVCPGVTIGDDTVVGAGAVVTRDLPAGVVAVGNPARVVRSLDRKT
ncbi:MAG TPA: sugar O-acetyltransferase [Nocardioidaceae bacterium]|nr:sugar O-acetyltransferase [Nocardioidaceae bacterium]